METLKVCLSTADFPPFVGGGLARYSSELFIALQNLGLDVTLITSVPIKKINYLEPNVVDFYQPFFNSKVLKYPVFNLISLKYKLRKNFDIIHSVSTQHEVGLSRIATNNLVLTVHNTFAQQLDMSYSNHGIDLPLRRGFYYYMYLWEKISCYSARKIVAISNGTAESLMKSYKIPHEKINIIYNGIDIEKFSGNHEIPDKYALKDGKEYILFVGRIVPRKGLEYLLHAFKIIAKEKQNLNLLIIGNIGDEVYYRELIQLSKLLEVYDRVKILENVPDEDLPAFYRSSLFFVFPSLVEGFGLVCLEAMACGKAVIASNIAGVNEVVITQETGLLVSPKDPIGIADAMQTLLGDEKLRKKMENEGLKRAKLFSWEKTAKAVYECYKRV